MIVAVQFGALPLKTTFGTVTMLAFEVAAETEVAQLRTLSTSLIVKLTAIGVSSKVVCAAIPLITGGSFTGVTFKLNVAALVSAPSVTVNVRLSTPFMSAKGVIVAVQFGAVPPNTTFGTVTISGFEVAAVTEVAQLKTLSTSLIVKLTTSCTSSGVVCAAIALMAGASFTAVTVTAKVFASDFTGTPVSVTVKVRFTDPFAFNRGVIVAVQFGAVPLNITPGTEIMAALEVDALSEVVQSSVLSTSVIVKFTVNGVSSGVDWAPITLITGGSLNCVTVRTKA